jgi:hypothetical protein
MLGLSATLVEHDDFRWRYDAGDEHERRSSSRMRWSLRRVRRALLLAC